MSDVHRDAGGRPARPNRDNPLDPDAARKFALMEEVRQADDRLAFASLGPRQREFTTELVADGLLARDRGAIFLTAAAVHYFQLIDALPPRSPDGGSGHIRS